MKDEETIQGIDCKLSEQNSAKQCDDQEVTSNAHTGQRTTDTDQEIVRNQEIQIELATKTEDKKSVSFEQENNNVDQRAQNVKNESRYEAHTQILEQGTLGLKQDTEIVEQGIQRSSPARQQGIGVGTNLSDASPAAESKMTLEIDVPVKKEFNEDGFYDGDFRRYSLRNKSVKKVDVSAVQNVATVIKKNLIKRKNKKGQKKNSRPHSTAKNPAARARKELYSCDICHVDYSTAVGYLCHVTHKHQSLIKFTCIICSEVFNSNTLLLEHKITHKNEDRTFQCMECKQELMDHCDFLIHQLKHQNQTFYKCLECGKLLHTRSAMESHIYTHFEQRVKCEICQRNVRRDKMDVHMVTHSKTRKCVECGKVCPSKGTLEYHMISHTGLKRVQCYYCGRAFANTHQRNIHLRTHTNIKPFECSICYCKFAQSSTLNKHMITHETEPRFHCDLCGKKYFCKESMVDHLSVHNKKQVYPCNLCKKPLSTRCGLKNHMLYKHSTERNYPCRICDKWFKNGQAINQHNRKKSHIRNVLAAENLNK